MKYCTQLHFQRALCSWLIHCSSAAAKLMRLLTLKTGRLQASQSEYSTLKDVCFLSFYWNVLFKLHYWYKEQRGKQNKTKPTTCCGNWYINESFTAQLYCCLGQWRCILLVLRISFTFCKMQLQSLFHYPFFYLGISHWTGQKPCLGKETENSHLCLP